MWLHFLSYSSIRNLIFFNCLLQHLNMKNLPLLRSATFIVFTRKKLCFESQTICIFFTSILHLQYSISQIVSLYFSILQAQPERAAGLFQYDWLKENVHLHLTDQNETKDSGTTLCTWLSIPHRIPLNCSSHASNYVYQSSPRGRAFLVIYYPWSSPGVLLLRFLIGANSLCDPLDSPTLWFQDWIIDLWLLDFSIFSKLFLEFIFCHQLSTENLSNLRKHFPFD